MALDFEIYNTAIEHAYIKSFPVSRKSFQFNNNDIIAGNMYGQLFAVNCTNVTFQLGFYNNTDLVISLAFCTSCIIQNNTVQFNLWEGMYVYECTDCLFRFNTINQNGIYPTGGHGVLE